MQFDLPTAPGKLNFQPAAAFRAISQRKFVTNCWHNGNLHKISICICRKRKRKDKFGRVVMGGKGAGFMSSRAGIPWW